MQGYTHNLKIILVDNNGNIVLDNDFINEIKNTLCKANTLPVQWNGEIIDVSIKWHKINLNHFNSHLFGDFFAFPAFNSEFIIFNHTFNVISNFKKHGFTVKFNISKLLVDYNICLDSCGSV